MTHKKQVRQVVESLGGPSAVGRELGVDRSTVCNWYRKSIPARQALRLEALVGGQVRAEDMLPESLLE